MWNEHRDWSTVKVKEGGERERDWENWKLRECESGDSRSYLLQILKPDGGETEKRGGFDAEDEIS